LSQKIIGVKADDRFIISSRRCGSFHAKVWSQVCGLEKIEEMNRKQLDYYRMKFAYEMNRLRKNDVLFLFRGKKGTVIKKKISPAKINRPWYAAIS
jgi:hypothetical protein